LASETDANPDWFGHRRDEGAADAPTTATSFPSMRQFAPRTAAGAARTT
jgi:hypothetical protein